MVKKLVARCTVAVAIAACAIGAAATLSTPVEAKHCGPCPLISPGVTCDDGRTYCNSCLAACAGAGHCVVTG